MDTKLGVQTAVYFRLAGADFKMISGKQELEHWFVQGGGAELQRGRAIHARWSRGSNYLSL